MAVREGNTSNHKELSNLVEQLERMKANSKLTGVDVFLFTYHMVVEYAFYKGNSSSKLLFELIIQLYIVSMSGDMILHVI